MKITKIIVFFLLCCLLISVASGFPVFAENETPEWKAVYTGYIDNILAEDTKNYILMSRYLLYDIDGNGIPELVISSGRTDADTKTLFFTCEDGQLVPLGELPTGFVVFDADDANDRMLMFRNLDEERVYRQITVKSNQVAEEVLSPDEVQEIEASFRYLRMAGPDNLLPLLRYEEICNYLRGIFPASESVYFPENNETFFEEIVAGSAGNIHVDFSRRINYTAPKFSNAFKVKFSGLHGGHSGIEISKDYANCIKLAAKFLSQGNFQLAKFSGGSAPNVIPSDSEFVVVTDFSTDEVATRADSLKSRVKKIYGEDLKIEIAPVDLPEKVFSDSDFENFVALILSVHSGVYSLNGTLVKTSANIGIVRTADTVEINILARFNVSELLEDFTDSFAQVAKLANFEVKFGTPAPAWDFNPDSKLLKIMAEIFESQNKFAPKIATSHGGLECSFFAVKNPALDIVSIGTTNEFIHSTKERLHLKTVAPHVNLIVSTLEKIAALDNH